MGEDADNTFGFPRGDFHFKKRCSRNRKPPRVKAAVLTPGVGSQAESAITLLAVNTWR
jgi:hypothetical protein